MMKVQKMWNCESVDICGFLMEALFVYQRKETIPSILKRLKSDSNSLKS